METEGGRKEPKVSGNCRSAAMLLPLLLGLLEVPGALGGCVEVASGTEAVLGAPFRLLCIACKRRSETPAEAESEWFFRAEGAPQFNKILHYSPEEGEWVAPGPFFGVMAWNGSRGTRDLQDLSVWLAEVRRAHAGQYVCRLKRNLTFEGYTYSLARNQTLKLAVVEKARRDLASIVSEILMYVLIVVLTLWLAAEMLYCYRKVAAASPPPDSASEYLAITSESKENCGGVQFGTMGRLCRCCRRRGRSKGNPKNSPKNSPKNRPKNRPKNQRQPRACSPPPTQPPRPPMTSALTSPMTSSIPAYVIWPPPALVTLGAPRVALLGEPQPQIRCF